MKNLVPWRRGRADLTGSGQMEDLPSVFGLHRQMNRLFDDFLRDFESPFMRSSASGWPALEIQEGDKETRIVAELPGLDEKDIDLSLRGVCLPSKAKRPVSQMARCTASTGMASSPVPSR